MPPYLPRISIITPSLNQGAFIEQTIRSVLDQGYSNLEYIIIDGGSQDETVEIIRTYSDQLEYWCSEPDRGQTYAINKGVRRATGDIVAYLCSDDQYLPGTFRIVAETFSRFPEKKWLAGACRYFQPDGTENLWAPESPPKDRVTLVCSPWGVPQPANFWRRELFSTYGLFRDDLNYVMDTEFQVRLALAGETPILVQKELAYSVLHEDCKSVKSEHKQLYEQSFFLDFFWDQLTRGEQVHGRVEVCFRESGVATKLGRSRVYQYQLYLKGLMKAFGVSPWLTFRRIVGTFKRLVRGGVSTLQLYLRR